MMEYKGDKVITKAIHKKYVALNNEINKAEAKGNGSKAKALTAEFVQMQNDYPRLIGTLSKKW